MPGMAAIVTAVSRGSKHGPVKQNLPRVRLRAGFGVEHDVHSGETVKHRSRARKDPGLPNLRQVHLIHSELHDELRAKGFSGPTPSSSALSPRGQSQRVRRPQGCARTDPSLH